MSPQLYEELRKLAESAAMDNTMATDALNRNEPRAIKLALERQMSEINNLLAVLFREK